MHNNRENQEINCIFCFAPVYVHNPPPITLSFSVRLFSSHELLWCWFFNARTAYCYINGGLINQRPKAPNRKNSIMFKYLTWIIQLCYVIQNRADWTSGSESPEMGGGRRIGMGCSPSVPSLVELQTLPAVPDLQRCRKRKRRIRHPPSSRHSSSWSNPADNGDEQVVEEPEQGFRFGQQVCVGDLEM